MNWKLLSAIVVTAALIGALWWREHGEVQRLQTELAATKAQVADLDKLRAELDRLAAGNQRLRAEAVDPSELARLRALGNDLRRLQGEKVELERKLVAVDAARAKAAAAAANAPNLPFARVAYHPATVPKGHTVMAGPWPVDDGRAGLAFVTPRVVEQTDGSKLIDFDTQIVVMRPEMAVGSEYGSYFATPDGVHSSVGPSEILNPKGMVST
jgi:hypothetical protein